MQFSIISVVAGVSALALTAMPALANDDRVLVKHGKQSAGLTFCQSWNKACDDYQPQDINLEYLATYCRDGDYQGENKDTEALVYCSFSKDGKTPHPVNKHIAKNVNAQLV